MWVIVLCMLPKQRILQLSKKHHLTHIGSNLSAYSIIEKIYKKKKPSEKFILSCGHSGLALYVALEKFEGINAEQAFLDHGIHATKCTECGIVTSTGSLGHGIGIAVGMALAQKRKDVYCLISDGECMEGSVWEALRLASKLKLSNLKIYVNANGYGGLDKIDLTDLKHKLRAFFPVVFVRTNMKPLKGLEAHYQTI